jgi:hypothetical protein
LYRQDWIDNLFDWNTIDIGQVVFQIISAVALFAKDWRGSLVDRKSVHTLQIIFQVGTGLKVEFCDA